MTRSPTTIFYREPTLVLAMVRLKQQGNNQLREFAAAVNLLPEVKFCLHLSGEYDFLLQVTLYDSQAYEDFLMQKLCILPMVERVQSSVVLSQYKSIIISQ